MFDQPHAERPRGRRVAPGCDPPAPGRLSGDDGAAMLEFALLLPFLSLVVFGAIDIGRVYSLQNRLTNMAREGGVYAQFFPARVIKASSSDNCAVQSITSRALGEDPSFKGVSITVTDIHRGTSTILTGCDATTVTPGDLIRVTASTTFQPFSYVVTSITGSSRIISGSIEVVALG